MQSNAAVRCRALLMVACAIAIPAIAIFGKFLPDFAWDQFCRRLAASGSSSVSKPAETPSPRLATVNPTPELTGLELPKSLPWPDLNQASCDAGRTETQASAAAASGGSQFIHYGIFADDCRAAAASGGSQFGGNMPSLEEVASRTASVPMAGMPGSTPAGDQFTTIQQRLRQLGATWYALETWGNEGRFHFTCRVSVDGNPSLNRLFQASDAEAIQAMAKVLRDVERWKSSGGLGS
jgi:hypothetical protein